MCRRTIARYPSVALLTAFLLANCAAPGPGPTPTPTPPAGQSPTSTPTPPGSVVTSYQAFASGLASTFTKGNICSLEQPFHLEGDAPPVSSDLVASFIPTSSTQGNYTFTNTISDGCAQASNGTYDVTFYSLGEGDILMRGDTTVVCRGVTVFSGVTDFRIAIKEAPGITCP